MENQTPVKDLYDIGQIPPLGHVPEKMWAWTIRKDRHGPPEQAMLLEPLPTWSIGDDEVLVLVMAALRGLPLVEVVPLLLVLLMSAVPVALPVMFTV